MTGPVEFLEAAHKEAERVAVRAADVCGCHPSAFAWSFRDGDEPTDGHILIVDDPHPDLKRKIGRRWNGSYEGLFMAEHIVRHDPEAVLRRVAAERKMLALHQTPGRVYEYAGAPARETTICRVCRYQEPMSEEPCATVRLLAEAWGWTEEGGQ